ncbi:uncharacterized protein BDZ99DRAFT_516797 [Mytilinidion resinicola]|uniref:Uncharacterized protein n=1 Tax=Mytilinidion resinicola TaxID=574789 RepID=A0A6A6YZK4_9PEZI|nr:uncharacterized protein BDZ99DRAFT_516797 [Mytilinidion resinicola]KAF2814190.1 hypothetical protein BDZ99DRAFT_516797 [Mytilinidion resinicola]
MPHPGGLQAVPEPTTALSLLFAGVANFALPPATTKRAANEIPRRASSAIMGPSARHGKDAWRGHRCEHSASGVLGGSLDQALARRLERLPTKLDASPMTPSSTPFPDALPHLYDLSATIPWPMGSLPPPPLFTPLAAHLVTVQLESARDPSQGPAALSAAVSLVPGVWEPGIGSGCWQSFSKDVQPVPDRSK